jgi:hypothetical protein
MIYVRLVKATKELETGMLKKMPPRKFHGHFIFHLFISHTFVCRTANSCFKDAADIHADLEEYPQAIARYEQVANYSLSSPLTKYSVKEYWLRAGLCALALGVSILYLEHMILPKLTSSPIPGFRDSETEHDSVH